jgi:hypothetical protein
LRLAKAPETGSGMAERRRSDLLKKARRSWPSMSGTGASSNARTSAGQKGNPAATL